MIELRSDAKNWLAGTPKMPESFRQENDGCSYSFDKFLCPKGWANLRHDACDLHDWHYRWIRNNLRWHTSGWEHGRRMADEIFYVNTYNSLAFKGMPRFVCHLFAQNRYNAVRKLGDLAAMDDFTKREHVAFRRRYGPRPVREFARHLKDKGLI